MVGVSDPSADQAGVVVPSSRRLGLYRRWGLTQPNGCHRLSRNRMVAIKGGAPMGFPDRIERTVRIDRPLDRVWDAITTAEGLGTWFGESAEVDLRVGGTATLKWNAGHVAQLRIERLEPKTIFGYTWR